VIFFFASAGASAGYLTVSEIFPLEVRAKAIAVFFAIAQCFGSLGAHLYGHLIGTGKDPNSLYLGYLLGAGAMILGGVVAAFLAVDAEGKSLEDVARPLGVVAGSSEGIFRSGDPRQGGCPLEGTNHTPGSARAGEVLVALVVRVGGVGEVRRLRALHRQVGRAAQRTELVHQQLVGLQGVQGRVERGGQPVGVAGGPFGVSEGGRVDVDRRARVQLAPDAVQARVDERAEGQVRVALASEGLSSR